MSTTHTTEHRPLLVLQSSPYDGSFARAALDMVMSFAVFAQRPRVLFAGDAVLALVDEQQVALLGRKSLRKVIDSFPLYDVEDVFADAAALGSGGADSATIPDFVKIVDVEEMRSLYAASCPILSL